MSLFPLNWYIIKFHQVERTLRVIYENSIFFIAITHCGIQFLVDKANNVYVGLIDSFIEIERFPSVEQPADRRDCSAGPW